METEVKTLVKDLYQFKQKALKGHFSTDLLNQYIGLFEEYEISIEDVSSYQSKET